MDSVLYLLLLSTCVCVELTPVHVQAVKMVVQILVDYYNMCLWRYDLSAIHPFISYLLFPLPHASILLNNV